MDSDIILNMMMQQIENLPNPNPNPNSQLILSNSNPFIFNNQTTQSQFPLNQTGLNLRYNNPSSSSFPHISRTNNDNTNMSAMREMIFRIAVMQPINIDPETVKPPKRKNVRISKDPQSVAARHRRERISERIRILQRLVPGGTKMDTASMLDEAIHYVKFLKKQVQSLEEHAVINGGGMIPVTVNGGGSGGGGGRYVGKGCGMIRSGHQIVGNGQILR